MKNIIPSKTRRKILKLFFLNIGKNFYLRQVVREVGEEVNAVKRELDILMRAHFLKRERRINKVFYSLDKTNIYYEDFIRIFAKESLLAKLIYDSRTKIGKIKYIALSFKFIKGEKIKEDEIYLLFVGHIVVPEVSKIISEVEKKTGLEINYTIMSEEELRFRKKNNDPFLWRFLRQPKVMLVGLEGNLMS